MRLGFFLLLVAGTVNGAAPPLGANEEVVQARDGCGIVVLRDMPKLQRSPWSELTWGGACIDGLATGMGIIFVGYTPTEGPSMGPVAGWLWYGRPFGETEARWSNGAAVKGFAWDHQMVTWNTLDASSATWDTETGRSSSVSDGATMVSAFVDKYRNLKQVFVNRPRAKTSEFVPCPADGTSCDAVWTQYAGPVIRNIKAFLTENEPKARARRAETDRLVARWEKNSGAHEVARRAKEAMRANAIAAEEKAAKAVADKACSDADTAATNEYYKELITADRKVAFAATLKQIYGEQCPGHWNSENRLKQVETLLAEAEQDRVRAAEEAQHARVEKQRQQEADKQAKSAERGRFWGNLLGAVGTAAQVYQQTLAASQQPMAPATDLSPQVQAQAQAQARSMQTSSPGVRNDPASTGNQRPPGRPASDCLGVEMKAGALGLRNRCNYDVNITFCTVGSDPSSFSYENRCEPGKVLPSRLVRAGEWSGSQMQGAGVNWVACAAPSAPVQTRFNAGKIEAQCSRL